MAIRLKCPKCDSTDIKRIRKPESFSEFLLRAIGRVPFQCEGCHCVFLAKRLKVGKEPGAAARQRS